MIFVEKKLPVRVLEILLLQVSLIKVDDPAAINIKEIIKKNAEAWGIPLQQSMFGRNVNQILQMISIEHVRQILKV